MPFTCRYGDEQFRYGVCYRPTLRKKILIHIHPNGAVQVDAPSGAANAAVKEAVQKRARWVITQLEQMREQQREVLPRRYVSGESHFYQGRRYPLKIVRAQGESRVRLWRGQLRIFTPDRSPRTVKTLLRQWYRAHARDTFERRLGLLAQQVSWLPVPTTAPHTAHHEETLGKLFTPRAYRAESAPGESPSGLHRLRDRA